MMSLQRIMPLLRTTRDDRGSLPMALLIVIVGSGLAALMVPMMLMQMSSTTFQSSRGQALHAAQSGIQVALGEIRAAVTDGDGDRAKLPCGPLTGMAANTDNTYSVTIDYFYAGDPSLNDAKWRADHVMRCVAGYGPYDTATKSGTPNFALLTSTGTSHGGSRERVLQATYAVKTTNRHVVGGAIPMFRESGSSDNYCMDAATDGGPIKAGNAVGLTRCPPSGARVPENQEWSYTKNLTLQLTATVGDDDLNPNGTGLCVDTESATHAQGSLIVVEPCETVPEGEDHAGRAVWHQLWSMNHAGHFEDAKSNYNDLGGLCLFAANQPTAQLTLDGGCSTSTTDPKRAWNPMPSVGAGQAGEANGQLVNFQEFGRCLDVTNQSTGGGDNGGTFLILYPCKQNPNVAKLDWNQLWQPVSIGESTTKVQWRTYKGKNKNDPYCLTSAQTAGKYVYVSTCSSLSDPKPSQSWSPATATDDEGNQLPYADKYVVTDAAGLCLAPNPDDQYHGNDKVIVQRCDGRIDQKWNADPNIAPASLINIHEQVATSGD